MRMTNKREQKLYLHFWVVTLWIVNDSEKRTVYVEILCLSIILMNLEKFARPNIFNILI